MKRIFIIAMLIVPASMVAHAQTLSLDSCKVLALENNKHLKEARLELEASAEVKKDAFTHYFPKVEAGGLAMKANRGLIESELPQMNLPVYDGNPANLASSSQFAYFPGLELELLDYANAGFVTAIQPLYIGGKIRNGNKLASLSQEANTYKLDIGQDDVLVETEDLYWKIIALGEKKKTLLSYENMLNILLKDVSVAYESGLVNKSDQLKVQLELNKTMANKLKLDNGIALLKMSLAQHVGIGYTEDLEVEQVGFDLAMPETLYVKPGDALNNRNEYKLLNTAVDAAELQKNMVRSEHMPTVAVGVQGLYLDAMEHQNTYGLAFATVSVPISGWWGGSHKVKEHQLKVEMAQNNLEEKSELIKLQIEWAYRDLSESYSQIAVAQSSEAQAKEHLKVVQDNFDAGVLTTSDLLEAQVMHQQTQDGLIDVQTIYKIKLAYYLQATASLPMQ